MNTDLNPSPPMSAAHQAPLVTLALFAYNQEKFIREAVEGAFAQTYEPLEIILSDDCSTDRTFAIMQEMAAAYRGPHRVRAVQTPHNLGVVQHVLLRGREAAGEIVVLAAGDDISLPERVARHVPCYADTKVWAVSTGFTFIDENSNRVSRNASILGRKISGRIRTKESTYLKTVPKDYTTIQGSTASYRKCVFDIPAKNTHENNSMRFAEDQLFTFIIHALGKTVDYLPCHLLLYRTHLKAISNQPRQKTDWRKNELSSLEQFDLEIKKLQLFINFAKNNHLENIVDIKKLHLDIISFEERKSWQDMKTIHRAISTLRELTQCRINQVIWKMARLWGTFPDYWPKRQTATFKNQHRTH